MDVLKVRLGFQTKKSYGVNKIFDSFQKSHVMTTIMGFLEHYEAVRFQGLSKTFYERHIPETFPVIPILGVGFTIVRRILHSVPIHHNLEASPAPLETW